MLREKSCGAVVYKIKETGILYLLLHYEAGHWDFVKGNVEPNESEKDTVLRELREETGIDEAKFIEGFREKVEYFYRRQGTTIHKEVIFYLIETPTEKIQLSYEHIGFVWLDFQQATERLNFKNAQNVLRKANDFLFTHGFARSANYT
jgi:8-oxo-dGTP pyrophosphatase MutT (NUDIX family)